ncbi:MAG: nuclear transport factor 2 family protein [Solirubrobacterales bacterium]|nr:nuclear transport factor 2 family protein [Solirubrobacterales bacterium]
MSELKDETIRGVYERWAEGDFQAGGDLFDPLVLFVMGPGFPETGTYLGPERVTEYTRGFLEPWERISVEAEEIVPAGDSVFAAVRQRGTGIGSGAEVELRYFQVWSFRGDRIIRFETFRERPDALAAAGLRC